MNDVKRKKISETIELNVWVIPQLQSEESPDSPLFLPNQQPAYLPKKIKSENR